jgi:hypothetical protein
MTKMASYQTLQGAQERWRTIDEVTDATAMCPSGSINCGAACGEMLFRARGVFASQEVIAETAGAPSSAGSLAAVLDDLGVNGTWVGGGVTESAFGQQCRMFFLTDERQEVPIALPRCLVPGYPCTPTCPDRTAARYCL